MTSLPGSHNITRVTLENGVTVLVYETTAAQSVVIAGALRAGSVYELPEQNGLASMTAGGLMRGTTNRDFNAIHEALEDVGADINISSGWHRTQFSGKSLAEDLPTLLDVLADVLRNPTFPTAHIDRLRGELVTGLRIRSQDTRYRASRAFSESLFPADHPYHYSTRGTVESVSNLTAGDLAAFHQRHYGPDGMILVVVGAVTADEAVEQVRARFADWQNPDQPDEITMPDAPVVDKSRRSTVTLAGKTQADIVLGTVGPSRFSPDYHAVQLANSVLGQFGMMGRIGKSVREELGLAYYAYSQIDGGFSGGPWNVSAGVNPANVELAIERIIDEVRRLVDEPIGEDDLSDNQAYFTGHLPLQLESNEGIAFTLLNMELYNLGLDYLVTYRDRIYSLTREDVQRAARRYLNPDALVVGVAGPDKR